MARARARWEPVAIALRVATALSEIIVGTIAQLLIGATIGSALLAGDATWMKFLAGAGAIVLAFLAGAELDPVVFRRQWKQATWIGRVSFAAPFLGCAALARWVLGWDPQASWLAGIAKVHDVRRRRLCGDAGIRSQYNRKR